MIIVSGCLILTPVNLIILIRMGNITDKLVSSCTRSIVTIDISLREVCVRVGVRYAITKFSWMDRLPNFVTHGAPLRALHARESSAIMMPGSRVEIFQVIACRPTQRMNQTRNRTACKTLLTGMRIASNLYIKMAAPGRPFSCNSAIKVTSLELASPTARLM